MGKVASEISDLATARLRQAGLGLLQPLQEPGRITVSLQTHRRPVLDLVSLLPAHLLLRVLSAMGATFRRNPVSSATREMWAAVPTA